ncbi:MAG: hypothetical protein LBF76_01735, partial [Holosporales bacterium]|nr:hypothetical protein [Holosporales bacterium]
MFPPFPENPSNQQREDGPLRHRKPFYPKEDERLRALVGEGTNDWRAIAQQMPGRNARQCRERWTQYLVPDRTQSPWTLTEEQILLAKYREFGAKWIEISQFLQGRSANDVKYRFLRIRLDANARNEWRYRVACLDDNRSRKGNSDTVPS